MNKTNHTMSFRNWFNEKIILPGVDVFLGQSIAKDLKFLLESQYWSPNELDNYQNEKLKNLINHCYKNVPYYKELFDNLHLKPFDIQTKKDLYKLPILTKDDIRQNFNNGKIIAKNIYKKQMMLCSSSGSTGEPLFYYSTKEAYSINIAANLRGWYWMGYRTGDKYVQLSQNSRKILLKRIQDKVNRNLFLSTNPLIDSNYEDILIKIEKYKPKFLRCYPDPLLFLARFKQKNGKYKFSPTAINTTGNTLHPETRKEIEESFNCKIFDSYSCEGNSNIFECPSHTCYHSCEEYGISEVLDINNSKISNGAGRLVSTDLWNFAHPFIRYDTQDLVDVESSTCICGRSLLKVKRILGRNNDILTMPNGRNFIVHNFTGFFQIDFSLINRSIEQFQVVKKKDNSVTFRLVVNNKFDESIKQFIKKYWSEELNTLVNIEIVNKIPLMSNDKHKFIISE